LLSCIKDGHKERLHLCLVQQRHSFTLSDQLPPSMRKATVLLGSMRSAGIPAWWESSLPLLLCDAWDRAGPVPVLAGLIRRNCKVNFYNRFRVIFVASSETSVTANYYLCASKGNVSETLSFFVHVIYVKFKLLASSVYNTSATLKMCIDLSYLKTFCGNL